MTPAKFRELALELPEAEEGSHQKHADFRVGGKIFATLGPADTRAMVRLPPELQTELLASHPHVYTPSSGAWGRQGCTEVDLRDARAPMMREALAAAWRFRATKTVVAKYDV